MHDCGSRRQPANFPEEQIDPSAFLRNFSQSFGYRSIRPAAPTANPRLDARPAWPCDWHNADRARPCGRPRLLSPARCGFFRQPGAPLSRRAPASVAACRSAASLATQSASSRLIRSRSRRCSSLAAAIVTAPLASPIWWVRQWSLPYYKHSGERILPDALRNHGPSRWLQQEVACLEVEGSVDMQDEISFSVTVDITIDVSVSFRLFVAELAGGV